MTKVYFTNITPLSDDLIFNAAIKRVSLKRREKVSRLKSKEDKSLSLAAGLVTDFAVRSFTGIDDVYDIDYQKNGKPCVKDSENIHISISHSGSIAVCAVSDFPTGVDVQIYTEFKEDICRRYFGKRESEYIFEGKTQEERAYRFFRIWTLKEAYLKMTGKGMSGFKNTDLDIGNSIAMYENSKVMPVRFYENSIPGYAMAVCTQFPEELNGIININIQDLLIN